MWSSWNKKDHKWYLGIKKKLPAAAIVLLLSLFILPFTSKNFTKAN